MKRQPKRSLPSRTPLLAKRRMNLLLAASLFAATTSAALAQDGRLRVWGRNIETQCNVPASLGRVQAFAGGVYHSVALKADGTVACWGNVLEGQTSVPAGLSSVVGIAAGHHHTVAVKADGTVLCWGRNVEGQLNVPAGLNTAIAASAGWKHTIALRANGTVACWGSDLVGACSPPPEAVGIVRIASGAQHNVASRSDGTVVCWGAGETSTGTNPNFGQSIVPTDLAGVVSVAGGLNHSVALKSDGTVRCWGQSALGQCTVPGGLSGVVAVAAGNAHTVALKSNGTIVGWGSSSSGQLTPPADIGFVAGFGSGGQFVGGFAPPAPVVVVVSTSDATCNSANGAIDVTCTDTNSVAWSGPNGFTSTSEDLSGVTAGTYTLVATGNGGTRQLEVVVPAVADVTAPIVTTYTAAAAADAGDLCTAAMADFRSAVVASDDCTDAATLVIEQVPAAGSTMPLGTHAVALTVRDASGNITNLAASFTVNGTSTTYYADTDADGYGVGATAADRCIQPAGHVTVAGDCNDGNPSVNPGAAESCNGIDDNCNGSQDEGLQTFTYFVDSDADGFGSLASPLVTCQTAAPAGFVTDSTDCDDAAAGVFPGAIERCADLATDNNCNGSTDEAEAIDRGTFYRDADGDGAGDAAEPQLACEQPTGFVANATDLCPQEGALTAPRTFYRDSDADGFGVAQAPQSFCSVGAPAGYSADSTDCDDTRLLYADADGDEHGAGAPANCGVPSNDDLCPDTAVRTAPATWFADSDADGYGNPGSTISACDQPAGHILDAGDCDDSSAAARPGSLEVCADRTIDNDCDGDATEVDANAADKVDFFVDADSDGHSIATTARFCSGTTNAGYIAALSNPIDCNDAVAAVNPGATEVCDLANTDDDCSGAEDDADPGVSDATRSDFYADADGDGHSVEAATRFCDRPSGFLAAQSSPADCDDAAASTHWGAMELCNSVDDDCNGVVDNDLTYRTYYRDADGDGYGVGSDTESTCTGSPSAGFTVASGDCDDASDARYPTAVENCANLGVDNDCDDANSADEAIDSVAYFVDADQDGFGAGASTMACAPIAGSVTDGSDCDDAAVMYADADSDGFGAGAMIACGGVATNTDCNDSTALVRPGAVETCANLGTDNDCDTINSEDEATDRTVFFHDADGDGFTGSVTALFCNPPAGYEAAAEDDCDDGNPARHPTAVENCANLGVDNDCDELNSADEAIDSVAYFVDHDHDGFGAGAATMSCSAIAGSVTNGSDCDDSAVLYADADGDGFGAGAMIDCGGVGSDTDCNNSDSLVYPNAVENCANLGTDNDCDGVNTAAESVDASVFYADADGDGAGDASVTVLDCTLPQGFVAVAGDLCPNTAARTAPATWYEDTDADGAGDAAVTASACDQPSGFVPNAGDTCPADGGKTEPGTCGCGSPDLDINSNGVIDCVDFYLSLAPSATSVKAGDELTVTVSSNYPTAVTDPVLRVLAAQFALTFDAARLRLDAVSSDIPNGPFPLELVERIDNTLGTLRYSAGIDFTGNPAGGMTGAADLAVLTFTVLPGVDECEAAGLVAVVPVIEETHTCLTTVTPAGLVVREPLVNPIVAIDLDSTAPVFDGVPADAAIAADARSTFGGTVEAPSVSVEDGCDGPLGFTLEIAYPGGATAAEWPANRLFPIGTSTATWRSTDAAGNETVVVRTIEVANHQLLDAFIRLDMPQIGASQRSIRIGAGASAQVVDAEFPAWNGATPTFAVLQGIQVPVAADYGCLTAKDVASTVEGVVRYAHSLTDTAAPTVSGRRYIAEFLLLQGDNNDDDRIDIYDFSMFAAERSVNGNADRAPAACSNFNGDNRVNNADFGCLSANFFKLGESCGGALDGDLVVRRVSVKELRRRGLGHLAVADMNRDGWVDIRDIETYMSGGGMAPAAETNAPNGRMP